MSTVVEQPTSVDIESFALPNARIDIDRATGGIVAIEVGDGAAGFVTQPSGSGLLRISAPVGQYGSHYLECGIHSVPEVSHDGETLVLRYQSLNSDQGEFPIEVEVRLRGSDEGLVMSARLHNGWDAPIPQIIFPQLMDLEAVEEGEATRVQLGRHRVDPFERLTMEPDDASWMDRHLHTFLPYGDFEFNMKWLDYGNDQRGLTLYSRDTRHVAQGIIIQRVNRFVERANLRWTHFPFLPPGETWESGEYVLLPHTGDWYAGARAYKEFTDRTYPYNAPQRLRDALAIRSVWAAPRNAPPNLMFSQLPEYAAEIADPDLGITELVLWHWWFRNGYPIFVDERMGTEEDFAAALKTCEEMGVPIVLFVSHHILRDTDETEPAWVHLNVAKQPISNNWTYGRDFLPLFRLPFYGSHAMIEGSALSPSWRETGLTHYKHFLALGGKGICFDVGRPWEEPNFNSEIDGRPDEEGEKLLDFHRQARELIYEVNPDGTYSAEHVCDINVPVYDYTWEWYNGRDIARAAPFRYVFPHFRLNANVNEHPRGALFAFMEGALLNIMPGNMRSYRLRDCPELVEVLRQLTPLRQRFLHYFNDGQFRFLEGLTVSGGQARLYTHDDAILVIAINPSDEPSEVTIDVDPTVWDGRVETGTVTVIDLNGEEIERAAGESAAFRRTLRLGPDALQIVEFRPSGERGGEG